MRTPLSPTLHIGLSPACVEMAAYDWRSRLHRQERFDVTGPSSSWQGAMAVLQQQMQSGDWQRGEAEVILSSHFVRHCVLPADAPVAGKAEQAGYVRHLFRGEYGVAVEGWCVAADRAGRGGRLACAIDTPLLVELAGVCRAARFKLRSVRPHLVAVANRVRRQVTQPRAWLAVLESGVCVLALIESSRWRHVSCTRLDNAVGSTLFTVLRQQALLLPDADVVRCLYIHGAPPTPASTGEASTWKIEMLGHPPGTASPSLLDL